MTDSPKFTREELEYLLSAEGHKGLSALVTPTFLSVVRSHLTLLDRAERAENDLADALDLKDGTGPTVLTALSRARDDWKQRAERAERERDEVEEAILWFHGYDLGPNYPTFPTSEPGKRYGFRSVSMAIPAVRRALERKGEWWEWRKERET